MNHSNHKKELKILLATDGSEFSKIAVENIANRAFKPNTEVRIISVYEKAPIITTMEPMAISQDFYTEADSYALKAAEHSAGNAAKIVRSKNPELNVTTVILEGSPKDVILKEAEKFGADLIVVGSHGYGIVERFLLGSVSQSVALHAKCSVEIVRK